MGLAIENNIVNSLSVEAAIEKGRNLINKPRVIVRCITYNQREYISQCLDGFISQRTDFPFVAIAHDDASTDGTAEVIKEYANKYPDIIIAVCDDENRYSQHTLAQIMDDIIDAYEPEYVAFCEGDDYWTDPYKLQKQVDYMEMHPECVMCHGDHTVTNGKKRKTPPHYDDEPYFGPGHIHNYTIVSLTTLYRYAAYKRLPKHARTHKWLMGDTPLWIELSREGTFHFFPEVFGTYRVLPDSASHSTDAEKIKLFWESENEIIKFYSDLYGYQYEERSRKSLYKEIQKQCFRNGDKEQARIYWIEANKDKSNSFLSMLFYVCNIYHLRWLISFLYLIKK